MSDGEDGIVFAPTVTQQKIISILFPTTSIISIFGSSLIILNVKRDRKRTPFRRLLLALSACDIVASFGYLFQPFLSLKDAEGAFLWTVGNTVSCNILAFLTQFGLSAVIYSAAVSFYFLLTIRFGLQERKFAIIERRMHIGILSWSVITSIVGVSMGLFGPSSRTDPGCWVATSLENQDLVFNVMGRVPGIIVLLTIAFNNILLYCHVRATTIEGQKKALEAESRLSAYQSNSITDQSIGEGGNERSSFSVSGDKKSSVLRSSDKQWKRVREVGMQSFLYVAAYFFSFGWNIVKGIAEDKVSEGGILALAILQATFVPTQGFLNMLVYFRPKYKRSRTRYPDETKLWAVKRAVLGEGVKPAKKVARLHTSQPMPQSMKVNYAGEWQASSNGFSVDSNHKNQERSSSELQEGPPPTKMRIDHSGDVMVSTTSMLDTPIPEDDEVP
mmetsp:Transcript_25847/g.63310  ORF Transcript_25847/g.63310 Transcript_25847/m.63310 type:complete len:445 (-) Transcript_25847:567-1901(-)